MDELINDYAQKLQKIYDEETAGAYTFHGLLYEFLQGAMIKNGWKLEGQ